MILIQLEGGLVSGVYSDDPATVGRDVCVMDFDTDGYDDASLAALFGADSEAHVHIETVQQLGPEASASIEAWRNS